jgi:hypothetical protein
MYKKWPLSAKKISKIPISIAIYAKFNVKHLSTF